MRTRKRPDSNLHDYLDAIGILENGSDEDIELAKKRYWKSYFKKYRDVQRKEKPEFNVGLSRKNGTYNKIHLGARRHKMTITAFLRAATIAYLDKVYLVRDQQFLLRIEQLLMGCLNEVKALGQFKDRYSHIRDQKIDEVSVRVAKMNGELKQILEEPLELENAIQIAIEGNPGLRAKLLTLLNHDYQGSLPQKPDV